jgi:hypothetical protein
MASIAGFPPSNIGCLFNSYRGPSPLLNTKRKEMERMPSQSSMIKSWAARRFPLLGPREVESLTLSQFPQDPRKIPRHNQLVGEMKMVQSATTAIRLAISPGTAEADDDPDLDPTTEAETHTEVADGPDQGTEDPEETAETEGRAQETEDPEETAGTDDDPDRAKRRDRTTEPTEDKGATLPPVCIVMVKPFRKRQSQETIQRFLRCQKISRQIQPKQEPRVSFAS